MQAKRRERRARRSGPSQTIKRRRRLPRRSGSRPGARFAVGRSPKSLPCRPNGASVEPGALGLRKRSNAGAGFPAALVPAPARASPLSVCRKAFHAGQTARSVEPGALGLRKRSNAGAGFPAALVPAPARFAVGRSPKNLPCRPNGAKRRARRSGPSQTIKRGRRLPRRPGSRPGARFAVERLPKSLPCRPNGASVEPGAPGLRKQSNAGAGFPAALVPAPAEGGEGRQAFCNAIKARGVFARRERNRGVSPSCRLAPRPFSAPGRRRPGRCAGLRRTCDSKDNADDSAAGVVCVGFLDRRLFRVRNLLRPRAAAR